MDEYQTEGRHECLVSLSSSHLIYETNTAPSDDPSRCDIYFSPDESHESWSPYTEPRSALKTALSAASLWVTSNQSKQLLLVSW